MGNTDMEDYYNITIDDMIKCTGINASREYDDDGMHMALAEGEFPMLVPEYIRSNLSVYVPYMGHPQCP